MSTPTFRTAVIGGGITGLAAAHRLQEIAPHSEVRLFEARSRLGGVLETVRHGDYLFERSADMFTTKEPWALDLCRRLGFADDLIGTNPASRQAFVVRAGKCRPVPEGFTLMSPARTWPILTTRILSPLGKIRLGAEYFVPRRTDEADESLQAFVIRRFGREAFERLIQPLIGGIYTADPALLSMRAVLPQFVQMEREHGSLIRAMRRADAKKTRDEMRREGSGARYGMFVAPRGGMTALVAALAAKLRPGTVQFNSDVLELTPAPDAGWLVRTAGPEPPQRFDAVIVAAPAYVAHRLLHPLDAELGTLVREIPHAGCSVVVAGYRREQIHRPIRGAGLVVPRREGRRIIAASLSSEKFAGRAPEDRVIVRTFIGGALQPELAELPDAALLQIAAEELGQLLGVTGEPKFTAVARWLGVMPQYHLGHLDRVERIERRVAEIPRLELAGNAYRGVGIPQCVRSGESAAEKIGAAFSGKPAATIAS